MGRLQSRLRVFDLLVAAMFVAAEVAAVVDRAKGSRVAELILPALWTLPLLARKRSPVVAVVVVFGTLAFESSVAHHATESTTVLPPVIAAFWIAGTIRDRGTAVATCLAGAILTVVVVAGNAGPFRITDALFVALLTIAPFAAGVVATTREARAAQLERRALDAERDRDVQAQAAVIDERARIARDLHDIVGHALSVMTVQAGAARLVVESDPSAARDALLTVESSGREALGEMRRMLALLRTADGELLEPQPGLADLGRLVASNREAGLEVSVETEGRAAALSPGVELAVYRIIQEALTNVRKHTREHNAAVRIRFEPGALQLSIENGGESDAPAGGAGHGITGMRERVALYGGELSAGPQPAGGFAVRVRLPLAGAAS